MRRLARRTVSLALGMVLALGTMTVASALTPLAEVPTRSWGVDGRVNAIAIVGDTAYVGGNFDNAIGPAGERVTRKNLAAFSVRTGELDRAFRADAGSSVTSLATDGASLYVGGHFGRIQGVPRLRLAKIHLGSGTVDTAFRADANRAVLGLDVSGGSLYVGGNFDLIGGQTRTRLAKLDDGTGAVDGTFRATANGPVRDVKKSPTSPVLYAAGAFSALNGATRAGVGAVNTGSGATQATVFTGSVRPTLALAVSDDGTMVFGALGAGNNSATGWSTANGARLWRQTSMGDVQAIDYFEGRVYFGFHDGFGGDTTLKVLSADARTGAVISAFRPTFNDFWGVFAIAATAEGLLVGGEFSVVGGVTARNIARFLGYPGAGAGPVPQVLLDGSASSWRYWDRGAAAPGWRQPGFADTTWASGAAEFGYGDGDEATVVSYGPSAGNKYITTYLRVPFEVTAVPDDLAIHLVADDGAVMYLNGVEVARDNMPTGPITDTTRASSARAGGAEAAVRSFNIDPARLVPGRNVLAIEVHQSGPASSDLSLDATVTGTFQP
jgi:hypothetical protein